MSVNRHYNFTDRNKIKKEAKNTLKYKDFTTEIVCMRNVKQKVISVITGATGTTSKSFRKYLNNIPGKNDIKELQKTVTFDTIHILWEVLM
jgi:hypothetical protein